MAEQAARKLQPEDRKKPSDKKEKKQKKAPKTKTNKQSFGPGSIAILVLVVMILGIMGSRIYQLKQKEAESLAEIERLEQQKLEEEARSEEIDQLVEYMQSDQYIEDTAKSKLGLAYDNEIIFKESEE